jgi:hypothetical protein
MLKPPSGAIDDRFILNIVVDCNVYAIEKSALLGLLPAIANQGNAT